MNQKDENWDFDGEGHRGTPYPSGAAIAWAFFMLIVYCCGGLTLWRIIALLQR